MNEHEARLAYRMSSHRPRFITHPMTFEDLKKTAEEMGAYIGNVQPLSAKVMPIAERSAEEHMNSFGYVPVHLAQVQLAAKELREGRLDFDGFLNVASACRARTMEDEAILDALVSEAENYRIASQLAEVSRDIGLPISQEDIEKVLDKPRHEMLPEMYLDSSIKQPVSTKKLSLAELARVARGEKI